MQQGGWSEAVVDRVMVMSSQNLKSAEIQLDPAELGRLEVRISVNQEQSQVTFASPHAGVREALDSQMHRLRELFAQQGMNQLDVNVSDQSLSRGWQGQGDDSGRGRSGASGESQGAEEELHMSAVEATHTTPSVRAAVVARRTDLNCASPGTQHVGVGRFFLACVYSLPWSYHL
jgi:flagellar hook-length control protein FliK